MAQNKQKNWCFTVNNFTPDHEARLRAIGPTVEYLVFGRERGQSGTPHLQGFLRFKDRKRFNQVRDLLPQGAHIEYARKPKEAADYCEKEGDFETFGEKTFSTQGKRTDLEIFKEAIKSGDVTGRAQLLEDHSEVLAKYPRFARDYISLHAPKPVPDMFPLRPWQAKLYEDLSKPPSNRQVIFIVDVKGNSGKSWFTDYVSHMKENVQVIQPTKKADMVYAFDEGSRIVFLDCPRCKNDVIQYDFLEQLKDGRLFNSKYESHMKRFIVPHVVVLMNEMPDETKLSIDRYDIRVINE